MAMFIVASGIALDQPCEPYIRIDREDQAATIIASCPSVANHGGAELRYDLTVGRIGSSGFSHTRQAGVFTAGISSADILSRTSMSVAPGDSLEVQLHVWDGEQLVASMGIRRAVEW